MLSMALTGHRPERLGYFKDTYLTVDWGRMIYWLKTKIKEYEVTDVYCGMASGCDIAYGIAAWELKEEGYPVRLHCVLPCKNYNSTDPWYEYLKECADEWVELADEFYRGCDDARDQYMVDHSDRLFAIWDGHKTGGVWSTVRKASKKDIPIIFYPKEYL